MDKKPLSERDICTKFITPAVKQAGWDEMLQIREEVSFTNGRIMVCGKLVTRGTQKRADYQVIDFNAPGFIYGDTKSKRAKQVPLLRN